MKTFNSILVVLALVSLLAACSKESGSSETMMDDSKSKETMDNSSDIKVKDNDMDTIKDNNMDNIADDDMSNETDSKSMDTMSSSKETTSLMNEGNPAIDFELMDTNGILYKLSDFEGKKVYIKFWASWCPICLSGLESLNQLSNEDKDFTVLTIVSPNYKNEKKTEDFIKWFKGLDNVSHLVVLLDEDGIVAQEYGLRGYPTSSYIGSDGILIKTQPGHVDIEDVKSVFKDIY